MCARTQFMTGSFLWADRPIMSKTNETMKHNAEAAQFHPGQPSSHRQSQDKCTDHGSCKVQLAPTTVCRRTFYLSLTSIPPISNPYHRIFSDKPFYMFLSFLLEHKLQNPLGNLHWLSPALAKNHL